MFAGWGEAPSLSLGVGGLGVGWEGCGNMRVYGFLGWRFLVRSGGRAVFVAFAFVSAFGRGKRSAAPKGAFFLIFPPFPSFPFPPFSLFFLLPSVAVLVAGGGVVMLPWII